MPRPTLSSSARLNLRRQWIAIKQQLDKNLIEYKELKTADNERFFVEENQFLVR